MREHTHVMCVKEHDNFLEKKISILPPSVHTLNKVANSAYDLSDLIS